MPNPAPLAATFLVALPQIPTTPTAPTDRAAPPPAGGGAGSTQAQGGSPTGACASDPTMMIMLPAMFALIYFMVIRPDGKRRKEQAALLASIKVGEKVVTTGGVHGEVAMLDERTVTLRVDTIRMVVDRAAIARVEREQAKGEPGRKS